MNYEKDIRIDENALDVEWLQQASLTFLYSKHAAKQRQQLELEKEHLNMVKAELDNAIRTDPEKYKITKITETVVANTIMTLSKYKEAHNRFLETKYESDMADAAVRSLQDKKSALENLVRLHAAQYFAGPSIPRDLSKEWEAKEEQRKVNVGIGTVMKRRG